MIRGGEVGADVPVYEVSLTDGTVVRFHDYETEDGGLRIMYKKPSDYAFPDKRTSERSTSNARPDPSRRLETYRDALIPFSELDRRCVSPIQIGTVTYKRDYEYERGQGSGLIFTSTKHKYIATGDQYVEYDDTTIITTKRNN